jgi:hypothetical protein
MKILQLAIGSLCLLLGSLAPAQEAPPLETKTSETTEKKALNPATLAMDGPGGRVKIGDSIDQAKKAFPPPKSAQILEAANYAVFDRPGWSWVTTKPVEAFEISLKDGKVAGIIRTVGMADAKSRQKLIDQTLQKLGKPTDQAEGKTISIMVWDARPYARFLVELKKGLMGNGPTMMSVIGEQEELKMFSYRVDDLKSYVKLTDLASEAVEKYQLKRKTEKSKSPKK